METRRKFCPNGKPMALDTTNYSNTSDNASVAVWNRLRVKISAAEGLGKHYSRHWQPNWLMAAYLSPTGPVSYESKNVVWMTKLTGRSMSQPIVVGDRIFLGSNISDLLCIAKN